MSRGVVVARVGPAELATLYEVREVLEGLAARPP
ncbi:DNA-binding GntR family transcriptional regulator [Saccharopolyspora phatthalungensis]|uniref:DNA-binding GntR family transcriptional regulator n=1 Tax=Saccharopolyspora phatthalungensis TaxID=664693 RepID=A0A840Q295_9PSEU|nr:DNA-binding GntR family transcriptional regulator [Saccharopolyspora phatthalungensis]